MSEPKLVVEHREALWFLLAEALQLEHAPSASLAERLEVLAGRCQALSADAATPAGVATAGERVARFAAKLRSGLEATAAAAR